MRQVPVGGVAARRIGTFRSSSKKRSHPKFEAASSTSKPEKEGLVVSLCEIGFYESGAATMRASSVGSVDRLAAVLASRSENMRIEGHTDNVPIHNAHFPSNWELSTSRATELVKFFIYRYQFTPSRLSVRAMPNFIPSRGTPQPADVPATGASISSS